MLYQGSCHCGNIRFEVDGEFGAAIACNCSICQRKGTLLWFSPIEKFHLLESGAKISSYTFNKHVIHHKFCPVCGVSPYAEGTDPKGNKVAAINVRCLENVDLDSIEIQNFNGRDV